MTVQPNAESLAVAARAMAEAQDKVHSLFGGYDYSSYGRNPPLVVKDERARESKIVWEGDDHEESERQYAKVTNDFVAQAAITAFLSAERARGVELRPREATDAMGMAGYVCALPVFEGERCEPNPHDWQKCWTAMWDAGAQK